jgi:tryptophan 2,3-dioxygenase
MARPSLFDSFARYLASQGYPVPAAALERDVTQPLEPSPGVQRALLVAYGDDGEPAQVASG